MRDGQCRDVLRAMTETFEAAGLAELRPAFDVNVALSEATGLPRGWREIVHAHLAGRPVIAGGPCSRDDRTGEAPSPQYFNVAPAIHHGVLTDEEAAAEVHEMLESWLDMRIVISNASPFSTPS